MMRPRKIVAALIAVGALALAGCQQSTDQADKPKADVLKLLRSDTKGSLRTTAEKTLKAKTFSFTMDMKAEGRTMKASGKLALGSPVAAEMTMQLPGSKADKTEMTMRMVDKVVYLQIPEHIRKEAGGKAWLEIDATDAAKARGIDLEQLFKQLNGADPSHQVKSLQDLAPVKVVGEEEIDGVKAVHYTSTIPIDAYLKEAKEAKGLVPPQALEQVKKSGVKEMKLDIWINEKYQVGRVHTVMGSIEGVINYRDWGKPINVTAPPAAETAKFSEFAKKK
jgi:hypothetical protein